MHIVTKFFVVVASLLAVLLSGLTIAYTSNYERVTEQIDELGGLVTAAEAAAEAQAAELNVVRDAARETRRQLESDVSARDGRIAQLESRVAELVAENRQLSLSESAYANRIDQLTAIQRSFAEIEAQRSEELAQLRTREQQLAQRQLDLQDRINDLTGQLDVATESNRTLQEQLAILREELDRAARTGGQPAVAGLDRTIPAPSQFRGYVVDVTRDVNGEPLVSIDAGSSDGLAENMSLMIVRNDRFLANVVVTRVNLNDSVGRANTLGQNNVQILPGDLVIPQF